MNEKLLVNNYYTDAYRPVYLVNASVNMPINTNYAIMALGPGQAIALNALGRSVRKVRTCSLPQGRENR